MKRHSVALWSALATFFGTLLAIVTIDVFNPARAAQIIGTVFVSLITAGVVYARQRVIDARVERRIEDKKEIM